MIDSFAYSQLLRLALCQALETASKTAKIASLTLAMTKNGLEGSLNWADIVASICKSTLAFEGKQIIGIICLLSKNGRDLTSPAQDGVYSPADF